MKKPFFFLALMLFTITAISQNVGIGDTNPGAKLSVKTADVFGSSLLIRNSLNDTNFLIAGKRLYMNGYSPVGSASLIVNNKYDLPFDTPQLMLVASGEHDGTSARGSLTQLEFVNAHNFTSKYVFMSYSGTVIPHTFGMYHVRDGNYRSMMIFDEDDQVGLGTFFPTARLQVNHRSTLSNPSLLLLDSSTTQGPRIRFRNLGGTDTWTIQTTLNSISDQLSFLYSNNEVATINGNGNIGIGTNSPQNRLHLHNSSSPNTTFTQFTNPVTGTATSDGLLTGINGLGQAFVLNQEAQKLYLGTSGINRVTISETGNVGIGVDPPAEKLDVVGNIKLTGEVNRISTGTSNLLPIAYGSISSTGSINAGSGNFSVSKSGTGIFFIAITGEAYNYQTHIAVVTAVGSLSPIIVTTGSSGGSLQINTFLTSGATIDTNFHFVVYKQ